MISKSDIVTYWKKLDKSPHFQQFKSIFRRGIIAFIVGIIIYQLFEIGFREVFSNLPTQPLFYLIFFVLYITLPTAEVFIYRQIWPIRRWHLFKAFLTKRVYNDEVMGYSGEFFLFMWARKKLDKGDREILKNVRDSNILSAISSNTVTILLVSVLIYADIINPDELMGNVDMFYIIAGSILIIAVAALIIQFRKYIFDLPFNKAIIMVLIYLARFTFHNGLMMVLWAVVIPETPISSWFLFVAIMIIVNRIPILPSRDLIFLLAGIELSRMLNMTTAAVAGMLLVYSALKKVTNLILFTALSYDAEKMKDEKFHDVFSEITDDEHQDRDGGR